MSNKLPIAATPDPAPDAPPPSYPERSARLQFAALLLIFGGYFSVAAVMMANGINALPAYAPLFTVCVILLAIVLVAGHTLEAIRRRPEPEDERDRLIGWRAESNASWILGAGVVIAITAMVVNINPVWVAHFLFASLLISELTKLALQLLYYRRGM
ncbi:MAG: hypothetical protein VYC34_02845 [Planctomycetota bacterium]|nr:hypothetical protein [Planctomycetota bacterium]